MLKPFCLTISMFALLLITVSVRAQVSVLSTASATTSGNTYTTNDLGGFFPPPATDKLVVTVHDEESSSPSSVTYAGTVLAKALEVNPGGRYVAVYFLDYATTPTAGSLVVNGSSGSGVSFLALQGTADGYGASTNASTASFEFDALFEGSAVVVGLVANQNSGTYTGTVDPPLIPLLEDANVGSSLGVSGYATNVSAGATTYAFSNISAGTPAIAAVAFPPVGADDIPPTITSTSATDDAGNSTNSLLTDAALSLTFDETVFPGSGSIILKEDGGTTVETYDVTSSTKLSFVVDTLTITPGILAPSTSYFIQIPSGTIEDGSGNTTNYPNAISFTTGPWLTAGFYFSGGGTKSTTTLREFDPTGYDKLVAIVMGEGDTASGMTWGGDAMTEIVNKSNVNRNVSLWYLDGPFSGPDTLTLSGSFSNYGVSLLALAGTDPEVAAYTNAGTNSVIFTPTSDHSFIVSGHCSNGGSPTPQSPLNTYFSRSTYSSAGGSGVGENTSTQAQTFSFTGGSADPSSTVIAEFVITPPPAGTVLIVK